jgi:uncharacterized protein YjbI with pentapeptide repeats
VGVNPPEPRRSADKRLPQVRGDPGEASLWPFGLALLAGCTAALVGLVGLAWLALALLHFPKVSHPGAISVHDTVGVFQLVFASVAGAGALVALIVTYRRQKVAESAAALDRASAQLERTRVYNERFTAAAAQIGDEKPAIRLAGVHAMAGLADDWPENRQTCVDVLCAYLRMPYEPDPGEEAPAPERLAFRAEREVRHTVIRAITAHLKDGAAVPWQGLNFDFTGVVFDGGDFSLAQFSGGTVSFSRAEFSGGEVAFSLAQFSGGTVSFSDAEFRGGTVSFSYAKFRGGTVSFSYAKFCGGEVAFNLAEFSGGEVAFNLAEFSGGTVDIRGTKFCGGEVDFTRAEFSGGTVLFSYAKFSAGEVDFTRAEFSSGTVVFTAAEFSGAQVGFSHARDWSVPPAFDWPADSPPQGVRLPGKQDQPQP